jgi:glycosyltransferase involved in cell wall biosynthesis
LEFVKWNKETEIEDLSKVNIGVMPLEDSAWTKGKCGFKGLQYMALQIPSVMSKVGVNTEIIDHGKNGFLCETADDWYSTLHELMSKPELRKSIGLAGQETVKNKYSVKANTPKYKALFQ